MKPEKNLELQIKTYCNSCDYCYKNKKFFESDYVIGKKDGKRKKIRTKPGDMYCNYGDIFKINKNHIRWWGFSRNCPFNIFSHTCIGCGVRMCSEELVCSGCLKNNESVRI